MTQQQPPKKAMSLKTTIYLVALLFILLFTLLIAASFFSVGSLQISQTVESNTQNHIANITSMLNHTFDSLLSQLTALVGSNEFSRLQYSIYNDSPTMRPGSYINLSNKINTLYAQNSDILESVFLYLDNNSILQFQGSNFLKSIHLPFEELYQTHGDNRIVWANPGDPAPFETIYPRERYLSLFVLLGSPETLLHGIFSVSLKASYLNSFLDTQVITPGSRLFLIEDTSYLTDIAYGDPARLTPRELESLQEKNGQAGYTRLQTEDFISFYRPLDIPSLGVLITIPHSEFYMHIDRFTSIGPWAVLLLVLLGASIYIQLTKWLSKPINRITGKMKLIGQGQLDTVFDVHGVDEINIINDNAQLMVESISDLLVNVYHEQKSKRQAELSALQSQINPHFLYNTLYAARQLCELGETSAATTMLDDLSTFYRIGISRGKNKITLEEELTHIRSYLGIMKMRYDGEFDFDEEVPEEFMQCTILKLTLQPLVENAIVHGIRPKRAPGTVCIAAEAVGHDLLIHVMDDGMGMQSEALAALQTELNHFPASDIPVTYGVKNVHQRLKLTFGNPYGLSITSAPFSGTTVTIRIPLSF